MFAYPSSFARGVLCRPAFACSEGQVDPTPDAAISAPACGNGHGDAGEPCDDHNLDGVDGCSAVYSWDAKAVAARSAHSCALISNGQVIFNRGSADVRGHRRMRVGQWRLWRRKGF